MSGEGYRILLDCRRRGRALRARSFTFDQIADVLALDHAVSPLRLYRYAHGRTASDVVAAYNDLDPAGTASLREARLYDYEAWPNGGRKVPARAVVIFARIYQTAAGRLLSEEAYASYGARDRDLLDRADHRHLDPHQSSHRNGHVSPSADRDTMRADAVAVRFPTPGPAHYAELLRALSAEEADVRRRELLFELALLFGGTPALGLLRHLTPPEQDRLAMTVRQATPVDATTIDLLERLTARLWSMDQSLGPQQILPVAEAKRALVEDLLKQASLTSSLHDRLLRVYWGLSHMAGWCYFDLLDYSGATRRYTEGLAAAHELRAPTLLAHLHGLLADMALFQNKPTVAMDHVFAAQGWARASDNHLQQAATSLVVARVFSGARGSEDSLRMLDRAIDLASENRGDANLKHLFWCNPDTLSRHEVFCLVTLKHADRAMSAADQAMANLDPDWKRERGILQLEYAAALVQKREIAAAAEMIGEAARATVTHSSARLIHSVRQARAGLQPWADNRSVRDLDERLRTLSIAG